VSPEGIQTPWKRPAVVPLSVSLSLPLMISSTQNPQAITQSAAGLRIARREAENAQ
ncbi:hypothetical protein NQZ68_031103, partial [Dissostichus eleginoides]